MFMMMMMCHFSAGILNEINYSPYILPVHYNPNYLIPFDLTPLKYCHRAELFTS
jgi:hypothetical protein